MGKRAVDIRAVWDSGDVSKRLGPPPGDPPKEGSGDPWEDAPFVPLGKSGMTYYFLDSAGHVVDLAAARFAQWPSLVTICGGDRAWLLRHWRRYDADKNPLDDFKVQQAGAAIMQRCAEMPTFDPEEPRRYYGAWPAPGGGVALHVGDEVMWNGRWRRAGFREGGALWVSLAPRQRPADAASARDAMEFERLLGGWNWSHKFGPALLLGLAVSGALAGLLSWRPHAIVVGAFGSGKSTLLRMLLRFCPLLKYQNQFTEPGLRNMLSNSATGVILDEAESDAGGDQRMMRVVEMLRRSSSAGGLAQVQGGGEGGGAKQFTVTSTSILGCTLPPPLTPQDASRFTVLTLDKLTSAGGDVALETFLDRVGLALWGRAIAEAPRLLALFGALRRRLIARGSSAREADQLGMIAAARWVMVRDPGEDPRFDEPEEIDDPLEIIDHLIAGSEDVLQDSGGAQAFQRLMTSAMEMAGDRVSIGKALERVRDPNPESDADRTRMDRLLQTHGLRWATLPLSPTEAITKPPPGLYVTTQAHPRLLKIFEGTTWAGQRWSAALRQLPDVLDGRLVPPVRIDGSKIRTLWISAKTVDALTGGVE